MNPVSPVIEKIDLQIPVEAYRKVLSSSIPQSAIDRLDEELLLRVLETISLSWCDVSAKAIPDEKMTIELSIYCKLWEEDGVWNSCAMDLPIAAFGKSIEEAKANLEEAIQAHFCAFLRLEALGKVVCSKLEGGDEGRTHCSVAAKYRP